MLELARDAEITSPDVRQVCGPPVAGVGIGSVEAPRGTLTHHYECDGRGVLTKVNMIVGTTNNYAPMTMSIKRAAKKLISKGIIVEESVLNMIEMAFRLYDPCLSCATHSIIGQMPLKVTIKDCQGTVVRVFQRDHGRQA